VETRDSGPRAIAPACFLNRPHAFEIVIGPDLRAKNVHHNVTGVDQHPIALGQSFDACRSKTPFLEATGKVCRDRRHMTRRAPCREHKRIREGATSGQIDGDKIFSFVVVEGRPNAGQECRLEFRDIIGTDSGGYCSQGQAPSDHPSRSARRTVICV
jgi:hypothetical protein